jgi:PAS domain S-box-containing protein
MSGTAVGASAEQGLVDAIDLSDPALLASRSAAGALNDDTIFMSDHLVQFYEDDDFLSASVAKFIGDGIASGDLLAVIATEPHREAFRRQLQSMGHDVGHLCGSGQLSFFDANEMLSRFMRNGEPNPALFEREVGGVIASLAGRLSGGARLRAYGEMVDVLWKEDQRQAAISLEQLWNDLQARRSFTLLCAYAMASFYKEPAALHAVCGTHTHIVTNQANGDTGEGTHQTTSLSPQSARRLAREIAKREEVERALRDSLRDLRTNEERLRASEEQLRDFVENATLGLHRVGPDGTILWANRAELELLGYSEQEYVGQSIAEFHADKSTIDDILTRLRRGEALHNCEARMRAKDGSIKHVLISSSVLRRDGEFIHTRCFTRDITARREAEESLRRSQRQLELITDALPVLVSFIDSDQRYRFVSAAYERWFRRPRLDILGKHVEEVLGEEAYRSIKPNLDRALSGTTVTYEGEVPYRDVGNRCIEATYIPQLGEDRRVVGFVALVVDITERKSLERFRASAVARGERLAKITGAIADAVSDDQVFEALVDHVAAAIEASSVALWLVDEECQSAKLVRCLGYAEGARQRLESLPLDTTPAIPALDSITLKEPIWISSQAELLERYPHLRPIATAGRAYRVSCLPLVAQGRVLGTLGITIEEGRDPPEDERDFLLLVARYASQAVERLRLFKAETRSRAEADAAANRLRVLGHASRAFADSNLDLPSRLRAVSRELAGALDSCISIALVGPDGLLHITAAHHPVPEAHELLQQFLANAPLRLGEGITGAVAATGRSVILPDIDPQTVAARAAPEYRAFLAQFPVFAMLSAPLRAQGRVIGTVTAARFRDGDTYTTADLGLIEELGERAAVAIESSRLYQETLDARSRAEQLYRFAQAVVAADKVEQVFDAALAAIEAALGTSRSAVLTFDSGKVMRFRAWRNLSAEYRAAVEGHSPWDPDVVTPEPVLVPVPWAIQRFPHTSPCSSARGSARSPSSRW